MCFSIIVYTQIINNMGGPCMRLPPPFVGFSLMHNSIIVYHPPTLLFSFLLVTTINTTGK